MKKTKKLKKVVALIGCITFASNGIVFSASAMENGIQNEVVLGDNLNNVGSWTQANNYDISWYNANQDNFIINNAQEFAGLSVLTNGLNGFESVSFQGKQIMLTQDIDLSAHFWTPIGSTLNHSFKGEFNGNGHSIFRIKINKKDEKDQGLFGYNSGTIKNIRLVDISIKGSNNIAGLAANNTGTIKSIYINGKIKGNDNVGGIVGSNFGTIESVDNKSKVTGHNYVGGIVGSKDMGMIKNSHNQGNIIGNENTGGVAGSNNDDKIENSFNTGNLKGKSNVGGVVGYNSGSIEKNYNTGKIEGGSNVGGVVGRNLGSIEKIYNNGKIHGIENNIGGVIGFNNGRMQNSFNTGEINGQNNVGGIIGFNKKIMKNSYNTGKVTGNKNIGGIFGAEEEYSWHIDRGHCYYCGEVTADDVLWINEKIQATPVEDMKSLQFVETLGAAFAAPTTLNFNKGLPPLRCFERGIVKPGLGNFNKTIHKFKLKMDQYKILSNADNEIRVEDLQK